MSEFMFQQPLWLLLLFVVAAAGMLLFCARRKVGQIRAKMGGDSQPAGFIGWHLILASVFVVLAIARPVSDPEPSPVYREGRDVIFVLDVSRSMLAEDMPPSRLEMAKLAVKDCMEFLPGGRIGLVLFAGSASIRCPLTEDRAFVQSALDAAGPGSVSYGSTFLQSAVEKVTTRLLTEKRRGFQDVILLTDGGDHGEDSISACADLLRESGARLLVVGFGNPKAGARIPLVDGETSGYLQDEGVEVRVKQEQGSLSELALLGGGIYLNAFEGMFHLGATYQKLSLDLDRVASDGQLQMKYKERFIWFLAAALLCLFGGEGFGRLRRRTALLLAALLLGTAVRAQEAEEPAWVQALAAAQTDAERVTLLVDAAQAARAAGEFQQAFECYTRASGLPVSETQQRELAYARAQSLGRASLQMLGEDPYVAASMAETAELSLLKQRRLHPADERVLRDLCCVYEVQTQAAALISEREKADEAMQKQLEALLKKLQELTVRQRALVDACRPLRPVRRQPRPPVEVRVELCALGVEKETVILSDLAPIRAEFGAMAEMLKAVMSDRLGMESSEENEFVQAEALLGEASTALQTAITDYTGKVGIQAFSASGTALRKMQDALALFANPQSSEDGEADEEMDDEDYEMSDEWGDGEMESAPMEGQSGRMDMQRRELPEPQFSAEEILQEEAANNEARDQKSRGGSGDVEKDW